MAAIFSVWAVWFYLAYKVLFGGLRVGSFLLDVLILGGLFFILIPWTLHRLTKPSKKQQEAARRFYDAVVNRDKPTDQQ